MNEAAWGSAVSSQHSGTFHVFSACTWFAFVKPNGTDSEELATWLRKLILLFFSVRIAILVYTGYVHSERLLLVGCGRSWLSEKCVNTVKILLPLEWNTARVTVFWTVHNKHILYFEYHSIIGTCLITD